MLEDFDQAEHRPDRRSRRAMRPGIPTSRPYGSCAPSRFHSTMHASAPSPMTKSLGIMMRGDVTFGRSVGRSE